MPKTKENDKIVKQQMQVDDLMASPSIKASPVPGLTAEEVSALDSEVDLEQKYGDKSLEAFGTGVARGVVPGFDAVAKALGVSPERLEQVKDRNRFESLAGEGVGLIGGAVATGGENLLAKASLGGAAAVAERKMAESIAKNVFKSQVEKSLARNIAEKAVEKGLASSVTGAGFSLNTLINENALGEADITGENLIAYAGVGAVLNGLVGGAFGAAEAAVPVAKQSVDKVTGQLKRLSKNTFDLKRNFAELASDSPSKVDSIVRDLSAYSDDEITKFISDKVKVGLTDGAPQMSAKMKAAGAQIGEDLKAVYSRVDAENPLGVIPKKDSHVRVSQSIDDYVSQNANKFDSKQAKTAIKSVKDHLYNRFERVAKNPGELEPINDFWKGVQELGKKANTPKMPEVTRDIYNVAYKNAKDIMHEYIESRGGPEAVATLKNLNKEYRLFSLVDDALERKANTGRNDFLNWKDTVLSIGVGALSDPLTGTAALLSKKFIESDLKRKLIVLNTAQRANKRAASSITDSIKNFFEKSAKSASRVATTAPKLSLMQSGFAVADGKKPKDDKEAFQNISKNLIEYRVNPDKLAFKIAVNTMKAGYAAPNATRFAQVTLSTAANFLYDKMPKDIKAGTDVLGDRKFEPSSIEKSKFARYVQAVEDPYSVLKEVEKGTVTREEVEALRTVYPAIYKQIQNRTMEFVAEKPSLSYNKKIQLGILLDIPTDASLNPETIVSLQDTFLEQQKEEGDVGDVKPTVTGMKELKISKRLETETQEFANRED